MQEKLTLFLIIIIYSLHLIYNEFRCKENKRKFGR